jgi:hypothetical protein
MSTILTDKQGVKARKNHRCIFCCEGIPVGSIYDYRTGSDCGDFWQMRMHPECNKFSHDHWNEDWEDSLGCDGPEFSRREAIAGKWDERNQHKPIVPPRQPAPNL